MAQNRDVKVTLVGKDDASGTFKKVGGSAEGLSGKFGGMIGKLGPVGLALGATAGIALKVGGAFIDTSSRLEALGAKSETVFGDQLGSVKQWAKTNAASMKLTSSEALGLATNMADLLIPMGFSRQAAAKMSQETIGLSGALSKWSGGQVTATEAAGILTDAFLGETDGLKALGISISAAEVDAVLLAKGQDKLTGAAKAQAEAMATQELVFAKSKDAQAGFAAGGKTLADRMESLKVKFRETWEQLVIKLTPAAERFADWMATEGVAALQKFSQWLQDNKVMLLGLGIAALQGAATVARAMGSLVVTAANAYASILEGAAAVARAFGQDGMARNMDQAAGRARKLGETAKAGLDAGATAAEGLARKLAGIVDRTITVTTILRTENQRDANAARRGPLPGQGRGSAVPARAAPARPAPARPAPVRGRRPTASSMGGNQPIVLNLNGRVLAESTRGEFRAAQSRGMKLGLA